MISNKKGKLLHNASKLSFKKSSIDSYQPGSFSPRVYKNKSQESLDEDLVRDIKEIHKGGEMILEQSPPTV
jgi:hypothetical protein